MSQGFDPNDPNSGGQPPPPGTFPEIKFTLGDDSGSASEEYDMEIRGIGGDARVYHQRNDQFGVLQDKTFTLNPNATYKIKIDWVASTRSVPDYDYVAKINDKGGDKAFPVADSAGKVWFICIDEDQMLGVHYEPSAYSLSDLYDFAYGAPSITGLGITLVEPKNAAKTQAGNATLASNPDAGQIFYTRVDFSTGLVSFQRVYQ